MDNEQTAIFDLPDKNINVMRTVANNTPSCSRRRYFKREARKIFVKHGKAAKLIYASLLCVMLTVGLKVLVCGFFDTFDMPFVKETESGFRDAVKYACSFAGDIVYISLLAPILYCVYGFAATGNISCSCGARAYGVFFAYFIRYAALFAAVCGEIHIVKLIFEHISSVRDCSTAVICSYLLAAVFAAADTVLIVMIQRVYMTLHLCIEFPEMTVADAVKNSRAVMRGHKIEATAITLSFIPWILLSVITVGAAFVLYVMPYFMLTHSVFAGYISDINSESIKNGVYTAVKKRSVRHSCLHRKGKLIKYNSRRYRYE